MHSQLKMLPNMQMHLQRLPRAHLQPRTLPANTCHSSQHVHSPISRDIHPSALGEEENDKEREERNPKKHKPDGQ